MAPPSTGPALPAPPPGVDLDAEFVNITPDRFTSVPKSSHRDGPHRLESLLALGVLTLYLSNKTGWKIPNAETLAKSWKEGADRIRVALTDMERAGFLVRFRIQGERGRWVTRTFVSADPETLAPIRRYAAALEAHYAAAKASKTAAGGTFSQVGPDGGFRDSVDRDSADRDSVPGHLKDQETDLGDQEEDPPPPPRDASTAPAAGTAATGGSDLDEETRAMLNAAAKAAAKARDGVKGWKVDQVAAAMRDALDAGHPPALVAERIAILAADARTEYPTRLRIVLDLGRAEAARKAAQPAAAPAAVIEGPFRYLDNDRPKCRTHPGHPANNCGPCRVDEAKADDLAHYLAPDAPPLAAENPKAAAQAAAARAREASRTRKADKRPRVPEQPTATSVDALAAAVAEMQAPTPDTAAEPAPEPVGATA